MPYEFIIDPPPEKIELDVMKNTNHDDSQVCGQQVDLTICDYSDLTVDPRVIFG